MSNDGSYIINFNKLPYPPSYTNKITQYFSVSTSNKDGVGLVAVYNLILGWSET